MQNKAVQKSGGFSRDKYGGFCFAKIALDMDIEHFVCLLTCLLTELSTYCYVTMNHDKTMLI